MTPYTIVWAIVTLILLAVALRRTSVHIANAILRSHVEDMQNQVVEANVDAAIACRAELTSRRELIRLRKFKNRFNALARAADKRRNKT